MILVDSGFLVALSQPRDALHARAQAWAKAITDQLLVTEHVLVETVNYLSKPADRARAHVLVQAFAGNPNYTWLYSTQELLHAGLKLHTARSDKEWSLTDCISFVVMEERKMTQALTHDHHFEQAGYEALLRRDP